MIGFFLINETVEGLACEDFMDGFSSLIRISKKPEHFFLKHDSIYNLNQVISLFSSGGLDEKATLDFIYKLKSCDLEIKSETEANLFCGTPKNGFLGVDFSKVTVPKAKHVFDQGSYEKCIEDFSNRIEKLLITIPNGQLSKRFQKDFEQLDEPVSISIVDEFKKAISRNLKTPFYPDTKIIKDVSGSGKGKKVMELRVYQPVALRVYFREYEGQVYLASVEQKSNPDQNADIEKAINILTKMIP